MGKYCFGVDVGGTTVKLGLFNTNGDLLEKWEIPTVTEDNGKAILPDCAKSMRRSQVDGPGQFSVRGDIVDIYAPDMRQPARVEYWDDEIDSISSFDLLTQRRDSALEKIYLSPAREVLFGDTAETAEALRAAIKKARGRHRTALEKATEADLAQLDSGLMPEAMDKYYGLRYPEPATLLDHLDTPLFILDEVGGIRDAQKATEFRRSEELTGLLEEGVLCPGLDVLYQTMDDLAAAAQKQSTLLCENFLRGMNEFKLKDLINAEAFAAPNWNGDLVSLREDLDPLIAQVSIRNRRYAC